MPSSKFSEMGPSIGDTHTQTKKKEERGKKKGAGGEGGEEDEEDKGQQILI